MKNIEISLKAIIVGVFGALNAWLGILYVPVMILVLLNLIDYITGIAAAANRGEAISSYKGFYGIWKKVCMWLLIIVGAALDSIILYAANYSGIELKLGFCIACLVALWLICNEIISILENMNDAGVKFPQFLINIVKNLKSKTELLNEETKEYSKKEGEN